MITLDQYLKQSGTEEKVTITAMNEIIRDTIAMHMKNKGVSKTQLAKMLNTSRAQINRILDPTKCGSITLTTLVRVCLALDITFKIDFE